VAIKVLQPAYFAREDTRTPMWYGGVSMLVNVIGAIALFYPFGAVGIAAALTASAWVNTIMLAWTLVKRGHIRADENLRRRLPLLSIASVLMGAIVYGSSLVLAPYLHGQHVDVEVPALAALVGIGLIAFAIMVQASGAIDLRRVIASVLRRG
jgi:putative peptidoglycan lipid II flippase